MENRWSNREADAAVARYAEQGVERDLALCVHATRLLGAEKTLVLHGGGNSSVKTAETDLAGDTVDLAELLHEELLLVKGSGWDMATMEPPGMTAVRLQPLLRLVDRESLSETDMVNLQRAHMLDSSQPAPSVEFLLHAFLPRKFICHTHADAVLAVTNQVDWASLCAEVFGGRVALVPYVMSGFGLARTALQVFRANPEVEGLVLLKHGLFTMGDSAEEAYGRMIDLVTLAEKRIKRGKSPAFITLGLPAEIAPLAEVAPILRGLTALADPLDPESRRPMILDFRDGPLVADFVDGAELARYSQEGTATPDYVIRTKALPLILPTPEAGRLDIFAKTARDAVERYQEGYRAYFARHNRRHGGTKVSRDPMPRVLLVPGLGLFGLGETARDAAMVADLAETNVRVIAAAESVGQFAAIPEGDVFDIEYWSPEAAKLEPASEKPLTGHVAMVTGAASGIGLAAARAFAEAGAAVALLDLDQGAAEAAAAALGGLGLACDVTDGDQIDKAFARIAETFGGVDIVVSNAGAAWQGRIGEVDEAVLRKSFELNFWSHQRIARRAVAVMTAQGLGGCLLFNTSKQAVNPGKDFGPYGLPKAATLFLMKQYALDHGRDGIRSAAVNADRIRSGLLTDDMVASRSKARGLTEKDYMSGNLLGREVTADDVAQAFVNLALARKTTAAVITVDGGNIEASLR